MAVFGRARRVHGGDFEVVGYDDDDEVDGVHLLGVAAPHAGPRHLGGRTMRLAPKPSWREGEMAPGVQAHDEGMIPLPMTPLQNGGVFAAAVGTITWQGQLQKPYRAERLIVSVQRTGATATGLILGQIFVGTDLQLADIQGIDLETLGAPTAFGTRLTLHQAPPGVLIRVIVNISSVPAGADTVFVAMYWLGRVIH
jgi:hypothetical protein